MENSVYKELADWQMCYAAGMQRDVRPLYCGYHSHPSWEIVYHISGSGYSCAQGDSRKLTFGTGDLIINPPNVQHNQQMTSPGQDVCVMFRCDDDSCKGPDDMLRVNSPADPYISHEMVALANIRPPASDLGKQVLDRRASSLWTAIMAVLVHDDSSQDDSASYPNRARQYIRQKCCTIERVGDIARHLDISEDYLRHSYKQRYGLSVVSEIKQARIEHAANLLIHSTLPLKIIASVCALGSEQYFCTSFKQHMGCTPTAYRKSSDS